jgi:hypothetical protein
MAIRIGLWLALVAATAVVGGLATGFAAKDREWSQRRYDWILTLFVYVPCLLCSCVAQYGLHWSYPWAWAVGDHGQGFGLVIISWLFLAEAMAKPIARKIAAPK